MDPVLLRQRFAVPGLTFDEASGLTRIHIDTPQATATIYLQGAHLTAWQPAGFEPAIFLSSKSEFAPGKAIRGGIPVVFPWFATDSRKDRIDGHPGPSHGFARLQDWSLEKAQRTGEGMELTFTLGPTAMSRSMGFDNFLLSLEFHIGRELSPRITVTNTGDRPLSFEQAFHTYYKVADIHDVSVSGLEPTSFIDKTEQFKVKPPAHEPIHFLKPTDRVYNSTTATCVINDQAGARRVTVRKSGSNSTIVWNPFAEMPDLGPWDWHDYVAVETGNVGDNAVTLSPGTHSTMQAHITLERTSRA
jgi:glucose-6-phosphate 1-epimerase